MYVVFFVYLYIDGFELKPCNSIFLNAQERQNLVDNPSYFNIFNIDRMCFKFKFLICNVYMVLKQYAECLYLSNTAIKSVSVKKKLLCMFLSVKVLMIFK